MRRLAIIPALIVVATGLPASPAEPPAPPDVCATFSIVGYDPETKEWGVAVASKFLAVGAVVPWVRADAGAVATQSSANTTFGPKGLDLMEKGKSAEEAVKELTDADDGRDRRQLGMVDAKGNPATFTGSKCMPWAGGKTGKHFAAQGNLLAGPEVVDEMAKSFEESKGPLAWRLTDALAAGDKVGGDKRGKQSAAIYVARKGRGYAGLNDRYVDFRVDDHKEPIPELARILAQAVRRPGEMK
jgi:uncharacterized Ntn-hydrolase superfamily protein